MSGKTTAKIMGDALVMDFGSAEPKAVWRCNMDSLSQAGFALKSKSKKHVLILKTPDHEEDIAGFSDLAEAEKALATVTGVFLSYRPATGKKPFYRRAWFYILLFLLTLVILFNIATPQQQGTRDRGMNGNMVKQQQEKIKSGVPASADDLFGD